ncbi:MAG TPA: response regulator transcription factor [Solirubrobacterales bacterium]|nr:response regulator transcription factor [Solirubrobacterales bacterium]
MNGKADSERRGRILVVDDEPNIADVISIALRYNDYEVVIAADGRQALEAVGASRPDLIVLDVMLPDLDGFEVARRLRERADETPILFLTAKDTTEDKVRGLTLGGDDYVTKPFSVEELLARIATVLRRFGRAGGEEAKLRFADLELDDETREVFRDGAPLALTDTEYRLLRYLMSHPRRVLTRAQILDHVWEYDFAGDARVLETYVSYLRKKLEAHGPRLIQTVRGVGYALRLPSA